ncbi:CBS domain-containing protein [Amycolatopsis decaplanina]|uniref:CBS domain containing membrane protein n=1 Tax=Amycolatopsis decaplanina DSM 44594 TaxID=1284240 RepID=M2Z368_9PSEU|nr:CBS domain-containing protein [Amycolatopsis decaplanina]EME55044.1 CBS domain containing membrane protein [Amycolatopsis decaplanina DSM 44594]
MSKRRRVREVMRTQVLTVKPETPFKAITVLLTSWRLSGAPVVDDEGRVVGVVSQRDLLEREIRHRLLRFRPRLRRKVEGRRADELMTTPAITVAQDAGVDEAIRLMEDHRVHRLPVLDDDAKLVGIVGRSDLLRGFLRSDSGLCAEVRTEVVKRAMAIDPDTLSISVHNGVVTVRGQVERTSMIPVIVALIRRLDGVVDVRERLTAEMDDSHLPIEEPVGTGVIEAFKRHS